MRILMVSQFFDPEPMEICGLPLARWLQSRGHDVSVLTGFPNYPGGTLYAGYRLRPWMREYIEGVRILRAPLYPSHDRSGSRRALNYCSFGVSASALAPFASQRPDVVYVYHPPVTSALPAIVLKALRGIPFVFHVQDLWPDSVIQSGMTGGGWMSTTADRILEKATSAVYRRAGGIITLSPTMRAILIDRGVPEGKVSSIYNWASEGVYGSQGTYDSLLANRLEFDGYVNMVYAGNLGYFQGLDTLIEAAQMVRDLSRFRLHLIGAGQAKEDLTKMVEGLRTVRIHDRIPNHMLPSLYATADAMVISLRDIPFFAATIPGKTQSCLAAGSPIVAALDGDAASLVEKSGAGFVARPGDVNDIAKAFRQMYSISHEERKAMGRRGQEFYRKHLSIHRGAAAIEKVLETVVTQTSAGLDIADAEGL